MTGLYRCLIVLIFRIGCRYLTIIIILSGIQIFIYYELPFFCCRSADLFSVTVPLVRQDHITVHRFCLNTEFGCAVNGFIIHLQILWLRLYDRFRYRRLLSRLIRRRPLLDRFTLPLGCLILLRLRCCLCFRCLGDLCLIFCFLGFFRLCRCCFRLFRNDRFFRLCLRFRFFRLLCRRCFRCFWRLCNIYDLHTVMAATFFRQRWKHHKKSKTGNYRKSQSRCRFTRFSLPQAKHLLSPFFPLILHIITIPLLFQ